MPFCNRATRIAFDSLATCPSSTFTRSTNFAGMNASAAFPTSVPDGDWSAGNGWKNRMMSPATPARDCTSRNGVSDSPNIATGPKPVNTPVWKTFVDSAENEATDLSNPNSAANFPTSGYTNISSPNELRSRCPLTPMWSSNSGSYTPTHSPIASLIAFSDRAVRYVLTGSRPIALPQRYVELTAAWANGDAHRNATAQLRRVAAS